MDDYLYNRIQKTIEDVSVIPEDSLRQYYEEHQAEYVTPKKIHLSEIALGDEIQANKVREMLLRDTPFEKLAKSYSVRKWSAEKSGEIGIYSESELGVYADRLMNLKVNEWTGPILMNNQYLIFKCLSKLPEKRQNYDEARPSIIAALQPEWKARNRQNLIKEIRISTKVIAFPEKLKEIHMN
jgi:peptidyl-prolyl cis-trans isomerase C/foldase protein PrsA